MPSKLPSAPTPRNFADAYKEEVLEPAARKVAGDDETISESEAASADATLDGAGRLAASTLRSHAAATGASTSVSDFVDSQHARALAAAEQAVGDDGRLSRADAQALPEDLRLAFHYLRTGEVDATQGPDDAGSAASPSARYSERIMASVLSEYGLDDKDALITRALELGDANTYLNKSELTAAAEALRAEQPATQPDDYDFSENVLGRVMDKFGIDDRNALLDLATRFDADGNRYLRRSELEAAAKVLSGSAPELGIVSDIDKTLLPKHDYNSTAPLPAAYPGVSTLMNLLEHGPDGTGKAGDMHYVTARGPDRIARIPSWMSDNDLPEGAIDTGVSPLPWVAQPEKVSDISERLDATGDQPYVLFGDNSHRDPEVYREIVEKYPDRVEAAFIHKVKTSGDPARYAGLHVIENYAEAAAILFNIGRLDEASARRVMVDAQLQGLDITDAQMDELIDSHRP
jgi:hypothetical protein